MLKLGEYEGIFKCLSFTFKIYTLFYTLSTIWLDTDILFQFLLNILPWEQIEC